MSDVDVIERLGRLSTPELRLDPTELVTLGQQRVVRRRWRRVGAGVAAAAIVAAGAWATTLLTPPDPTLRLAQEPWVAQESDRVDVFADLTFQDDVASLSIARDAGATRSTATITINGQIDQNPAWEQGPGGVEIPRSEGAAVLIAPAGPDVYLEEIWEEDGGCCMGGQGQQLVLAGQPLQVSFLAQPPPDLQLIDVIAYERGEVVTASGVPVESLDIETEGVTEHFVWVPALQRWGLCNGEAGCSTQERRWTLYRGHDWGRGREGEMAIGVLPTGATDIRFVMDGGLTGTVHAVEITGGTAVMGALWGDDYWDLRTDDQPIFVWTNADGSPGTQADLFTEP